MELATTPMTERQRKYRENYRERVAGWYNGWLHIVLIYIDRLHRALRLSREPPGFALVGISHRAGRVPVRQFLRMGVHRYVMHRPSNISAFRAVYSRHTLMHHQFFTEQEMRFADHHDWRVTFFPPYALVVFTFMSIPPAIVAGLVVSPNVGWLLITTTTSMYLIYEFMHFCCHVEENWFVRTMPFVNTIRRHHTAHHNQSIMMERNMNLTFPIMDCLMGTSDLNRGVLGHVFNGYDTRYVKTDMRKTARTPRVMPAAVPAE